MKFFLLISGLLFTFFGYGQKKNLETKFITTPIVIDGKINEQSWEQVASAADFVMFQPDNGKPVIPERRTEVKVLYDNTAIYIAAKMYDNEPNKILREISKEMILVRLTFLEFSLMVTMTDSKIFNSLSMQPTDKLIVWQQIQMEKIILGMRFGIAKL